MLLSFLNAQTEIDMYRIGELAIRCDVTADTIRFYEKSGLLSPAIRNASGYRLYSEADKAKVRFIRRAKNTGFTLQEISELLSIRVDPQHHTCGEVKTIADDKIVELEHRIRELKRFQTSLVSLSEKCCGGEDSATGCSILDALEDH
jgi:MerR family Zn(II)-responsive transcriptional regulator of zntA|tara:strand:- start:4759 stop:5199 length:441 start_codon:yes stop_codon:yes gene_type:complete